MKESSFKITTQYLIIAIIPVFYLIFFWIFRFGLTTDNNSNIFFVSIFLLAICIALGSYSLLKTRLVRLIISEQGIELKSTPFNIENWKLNWEEITEVLAVYGPMGSHQIIFKNNKKNRILQLRQWQPEFANSPLLKKQSFFTLSLSSKTDPEDYILYQSIKSAMPIRDATSREAAEIINKQIDLGDKAGKVCAVAVVMVLIVIITRFLMDARTIESGWISPITGLICLAGGLVAFKYLKEGPNKFANTFICILFIGASFFAVRSSLQLVISYMGNETKTSFYLASQDAEHQVWKTRQNELFFEIYSSPDNFVYTQLNTEQQVPVKSALGNTAIKFSQLENFVKDPSKRRKRNKN